MRTESGRAVDADLVVMGTGAVPDVMLARSPGLELGETGGVACSSPLATSAEGVWCAGDACEYDSVLHGRRDADRALGGRPRPGQGGRGRRRRAAPADFAEVPYFWSDLADWATVEYVGAGGAWDREVVRGSFDDGEFAVFYLDGRAARRRAVGRAARGPHAARGGCSPRAAELGGRADALADARARTSRALTRGAATGARRSAAGPAGRRRGGRTPSAAPAGCPAAASRRRGGARSPRGRSAGPAPS